MATGWLTNSKGQKRYFYKTSGYMATKWVKNKSKNISYYFATSTGYMYTGLKTINQKNYYFKSNGVMAVSTSVTVKWNYILHRSRRSGHCEDYQTKI